MLYSSFLDWKSACRWLLVTSVESFVWAACCLADLHRLFPWIPIWPGKPELRTVAEWSGHRNSRQYRGDQPVHRRYLCRCAQWPKRKTSSLITCTCLMPQNKPTASVPMYRVLAQYRKLDPGPIEEIVFYDHPSGRAFPRSNHILYYSFPCSINTLSTAISFPHNWSENHLVSIRLPKRKKTTLQSAGWISTAVR